MSRTPSKERNAVACSSRYRSISPDFKDVKVSPIPIPPADSIESSAADALSPGINSTADENDTFESSENGTTSLAGKVKDQVNKLKKNEIKLVEWGQKLIKLQTSRIAASSKVNLLVDEICLANELISAQLAAEKERSMTALAKNTKDLNEQLQMKQRKVERCNRLIAELKANQRSLEQQLGQYKKTIEDMKDAIEAGRKAYDRQADCTLFVEEVGENDVELIEIDDPLEQRQADQEIACPPGQLVDVSNDKPLQLEHAETNAQLVKHNIFNDNTADLTKPNIRTRSSSNVEVGLTAGKSTGFGAVEKTSATFVTTRSRLRRMSGGEPKKFAPATKKCKPGDPSELYSCLQCGKEYHNPVSLYAHKQDCGKPKRRCPNCSKMYTYRSLLSHVKQQTCLLVATKLRTMRKKSTSVIKCPYCDIFETYSTPGLCKHVKACKLKKERQAASIYTDDGVDSRDA